jgi:hypothetical protein
MSPASPPSPPASGGNASPAGPQPAPFSDRASKRFHENLPKNRFLKKLREVGILGPDEQVLAVAPMMKLPQAVALTVWLGLLPGLIILIGFQRQCWLIVTDRDVVLTGFFQKAPKPEQAIRVPRPVYLSLAENPKPSHFFGNKVTLPPEIASRLGRETLQAVNGNLADYAFSLARTPSRTA